VCSDSQPAAVALLVDLTPRSHPSHRTHNEEPATLVAALHADLLAVAVVLIRLMLYQTMLAASSSPWWRFPSRAEVLQYLHDFTLQSTTQLDVATPSRGLMLACGLEVCWELCCRMPRRRRTALHYTALPLATRATRLLLGTLPISTSTSANPATDVSSTLLGLNLDALGCASKGKPFAQLPDL
jgi:hypothetical protein